MKQAFKNPRQTFLTFFESEIPVESKSVLFLSELPCAVNLETQLLKCREVQGIFRMSVVFWPRSLCHMVWAFTFHCSATMFEHPGYACLFNTVSAGHRVVEVWACVCSGASLVRFCFIVEGAYGDFWMLVLCPFGAGSSWFLSLEI